MQAMISESDEGTRATAFSLIEVFVLSAAVLGPLIGSVLLPFVGVDGLLILHGLSLVPATWVRARELKETRQVVPAHLRQPKQWRLALAPSVLWIIGAYMLASFALGLTAAGPFYAMMAHDVWGLADQQIQQVLSISSLAAFAGVWLGSHADRWGVRRVWVLATIGFAATLAGWGLSPTAGVGVIFMMFNTLFFETVYIAWETLLAHRTTAESRSLVFGLCGTLGGGMQATGPAVGTGLVRLTGLPATFLAGALVAAVGAVAVLPVSEGHRDGMAASSSAE
jgi:MFS family permease